MNEADLTRSDFEYSVLKECSFRKATIANANFNKADLSAGDLAITDMRNANFNGAMLAEVKLTPLDVTDSINKANLERIHTEQTRLGTITNIRPFINEIPDKEKRHNIRLLLEIVLQSNRQNGFAKLRMNKTSEKCARNIEFFA